MSEQAPLTSIGKPLRWIGNGICVFGALLVAGGTVVAVAYGEFEIGFYIIGGIVLAIGLAIRWGANFMEGGGALDLPSLAGNVFMGAGAIMVVGGIALTFEEPGGIALIVFGLVFGGAGYMARRVFATPDAMKKVAVSSHTVSTGRGTHSQTSYIHVPEDASEAEVEAARAEAKADQIDAREDWAAGRIEAQESRAGNWYFIAAILWTLLCVGLGAAGYFWDGFMYLPAAAVGLGAAVLWVMGVRNSMRQNKFGASHFAVEQMPARPGGPLTGTIETGVAKATPPADGFRVCLRCYHRHETQVRMSGDERHSTRRTTKVLWESEGSHPGQNTARHDAMTVPVAFDLPADQPASTAWHSNNGVRWELEVTAEMPGIDYKATFVVPVQD